MCLGPSFLYVAVWTHFSLIPILLIKYSYLQDVDTIEKKSTCPCHCGATMAAV